MSYPQTADATWVGLAVWQRQHLTGPADARPTINDIHRALARLSKDGGVVAPSDKMAGVWEAEDRERRSAMQEAEEVESALMQSIMPPKAWQFSQ
jgi:hypothetical protein